MDFEPAKIIVSAIAGGASGLVFASWKVSREEVAKRRAAAKDRVHDAVGEVLGQVVAYKADIGHGRSPSASQWMTDYIWASQVLTAAKGLGPVRRRLVAKRLRRLVGVLAFELAVAKPAQDAHDGTGQALAWLVLSKRSGKYPKGASTGLLELALRQPPSSKAVASLHRQMLRLAKSL